jgi:Fe-S-cluster containining protein
MNFHLPSIAHFRCQNSGFCCQSFLVPVSEKEQKDLASLALERKIPEIQGVSYLRPTPGGEMKYALTMNEQNRCHFLDEQALCKIHKCISEKAKPLACQLYPYSFVAAPDGIYTDLKFSCPSVASGKGPLVRENLKEVEILYKRQAQSLHIPRLPDEIEIAEKKVSWREVKAIESLLEETLNKQQFPFSERLLLLLEVFDLIRQSLGGKDSKKRIEFWRILAEGIWKRAEKAQKKPSKPLRLKGSQRKMYLQMIHYFAQPLGRSANPLQALEQSQRSLKSLLSGIRMMWTLGSFELPLTHQRISVKSGIKAGETCGSRG